MRGRPEAGEFAPYASAYIDLVPGDDVLHASAAQLKGTESLVADIDEQTASERSYAPGKWTVKQVVGHLTDTERIFGYRALCVGRSDARPLPGFDRDEYALEAIDLTPIIDIKPCCARERTEPSGQSSRVSGIDSASYGKLLNTSPRVVPTIV